MQRAVDVLDDRVVESIVAGSVDSQPADTWGTSGFSRAPTCSNSSRALSPLAHVRTIASRARSPSRPSDPSPATAINRTPETYAIMGELVTVRVTAEQTGGAVSMLEHVSPRGMATPLHAQPNEDEEAGFELLGPPPFEA